MSDFTAEWEEYVVPMVQISSLNRNDTTISSHIYGRQFNADSTISRKRSSNTTDDRDEIIQSNLLEHHLQGSFNNNNIIPSYKKRSANYYINGNNRSNCWTVDELLSQHHRYRKERKFMSKTTALKDPNGTQNSKAFGQQ
jgi:hypothetical protein